MTDPALRGELAQLNSEYEILGELGRGGSAVVYRARDRGLGRDVAIKVVHPRPLSPDDDAVARLAREARTVAQLQHPNIVTVFAVRSLAGGGLALVMQLVPGRTLKALVHQDGPFRPDRCERVLRDVASALAYAHSRGVVHRDVKPENIFIDEESGRALLSDFGIARSDDFESLTLTGTAIGTPFYMSPEQIDGDAVDGRSDLYSLGLVAWEMLTGRRPWDGESLYNVIYKQKHEELPPVEALRNGVPTRLQYIVERMLQKNPAARWAGAEGLLVQLSHTVLPGDYSRWQVSLRRRVERYRAEEKERERAVEVPATGGGLLASTMRFMRRGAPDGGARAGARRGGGRLDLASKTAEEPAAAVAALSDTMVVRPGDALPKPSLTPDPRPRLTPAAHGATSPATAAAPTAAVMAPAVDPTWAMPSSPTAGRRWLFGGTAIVALGAVAVLTVDDRALANRLIDRVWASEAVSTAPTAASTAEPTTDAAIAPLADSAASLATPLGMPRAAASAKPTILALGARHTCAVAISGAVHCWGANERGQLGDGTAQRQLAPVLVAAELSFAGVTAGAAQSCGVTRTGDVYCWGNDSNGQLGDATTVRRNAPVRTAGPGIYRTVAGGDSHTCAITVESSVHCWGANGRGQVGDGGNRSRTIPTPVALPATASRVAQLVAGSAHSCALTTDGAAYCWGANDRGQLGVEGGDRRTPMPVDGSTPFVRLAAGSQHTCALTDQGEVWCWGSNARGQLGTGGARSPVSKPQKVALPLAAAELTAGGQHTCAVLRSGEAYCWGANGAGQLGSGTIADSPRPTQVRAPEPLTTIAAGGTHTCGLSGSGALMCWGNNGDGQLGDATRLVRSLPTRVAFADASPARTASRPAAIGR